MNHIVKHKKSEIYKGKEYQEALERDIQRNKEKIKDIWLKIARWFSKSANEVTLQEVANYVKEEGKIVIVNLSGEEAKRKGLFWDEDIRYLRYFVLNELLSHIKWVAEEEYLKGNTLNTLIVLDEAHRFAPYESPNNDELRRLKLTLVDAVRTTRKYGIGWMFISQTFSSIDKEILNQLRVFFIGYGLNYGSEWNRLREIMGGEEVLEIYQTFGDPLIDRGTRRPSFVVKGPIIPFIPTSKAIAIDVLRFPDEFIEANFPDMAREP